MALAKLPTGRRAALVLVGASGFPYEEAAADPRDRGRVDQRRSDRGAGAVDWQQQALAVAAVYPSRARWTLPAWGEVKSHGACLFSGLRRRAPHRRFSLGIGNAMIGFPDVPGEEHL